MKKIFSTLLLIWIGLNANSQVLKQGDVLVDAYYGFPDWYKAIFKSDYQGYTENLSIKSTGHLGMRGEYLVTRRLGIGLDIWHVQTRVTGNETFSIYAYDDNDKYYRTVNTIHFEEKLSRLTVLGRLLIHLGNNDKVDPYVHVGIGTTKYNYSRSPKNEYDEDYFGADFPLGFRTGFGARVMFTEHFGANADVGIGGPLFTTGLTYKF